MVASACLPPRRMHVDCALRERKTQKLLVPLCARHSATARTVCCQRNSGKKKRDETGLRRWRQRLTETEPARALPTLTSSICPSLPPTPIHKFHESWQRVKSSTSKSSALLSARSALCESLDRWVGCDNWALERSGGSVSTGRRSWRGLRPFPFQQGYIATSFLFISIPVCCPNAQSWRDKDEGKQMRGRA